MQAGDFAVMHWQNVDSIPADAVALAERQPWTHVISALDSDHYLNPIWPKLISVAGDIAQAGRPVLICKPDLSDTQRKRVADALASYVGLHYSLLELAWCGLTIAFPPLRKIRDPRHKLGLVCSTSLAHAYAAAGCWKKLRLPYDIDADSVTPAMLADAWQGFGEFLK